MRRFTLIISAVGVAALALATTTAVAAAAREPRAPSAFAFSLTGGVAGSIRSDANENPLTIVFTEHNTGSVSASEDVVLESVTNMTVVNVTCVLAGGEAINPDGNDCEPGFLSHGQRASSVIYASVTGSSGSASARACLSDEGNGHVGPCKTVSVPI